MKFQVPVYLCLSHSSFDVLFRLPLPYYSDSQAQQQYYRQSKCSIDDGDVAPWLILHHKDGSLTELDDGSSGPPCDAFVDITPKKLDDGLGISAKNGFVSLAVGETKTFDVQYCYSGQGVELKAGGRYSLCHRGSWVRWWRWGTLEVSLLPMIFLALFWHFGLASVVGSS